MVTKSTFITRGCGGFFFVFPKLVHRVLLWSCPRHPPPSPSPNSHPCYSQHFKVINTFLELITQRLVILQDPLILVVHWRSLVTGSSEIVSPFLYIQKQEQL